MSVVARRKQTITEMLPEPCLVCGQMTSTLHLRINICYACAAFFRRSANAWKGYKCQSQTKDCDLTTQKRPLCRLCRYNRCVELNLKTCNNDPTCFEVTLPSDDTDPWNVVDMLHQINLIFKKQSSRIADDSDPFTNFSSILTNLIEAAKPKTQIVPVRPLSHKSKTVRAWFQKNVALNTAKLLTCCPEFQKLPFEEKVIIHDKFWQMLILLLNFYCSYEYFGRDPTNIKGVVDNYQFVDPTSIKTCFKIDDDNSDGIRCFVMPYQYKLHIAFREFQEFNITLFEFNYICLVALWSFHDLPDLCPQTHQTGEKIISDASSKLHEYYTEVLRLQNYAARQAKLYKLANMVEQFTQYKTEVLKAWSVFNFGKHAFPFCKFETNYYTYRNL
uniref:Uncharacterized protein n=1 Tax=Panagrolaimus sp. PS1159 TaxID=55785 RepID=A0AC35GRX5_9BILA